MSESRRRALMGAARDDNPKYISDKGRTYRKYMTMKFNAAGQTIQGMLDWYGLMTEMEELTITGGLKAPTRTNMTNGKVDWSLYAPNLKKLLILPTKCFDQNGNEMAYFNFGHYAFSGLPKLKIMQLGGLPGDGYCYFNNGGYFRDDNGTKTVGTSAGLHLDVYRKAYDAKGGFANGTKASSTVVTCYNKDTGKVMTA